MKHLKRAFFLTLALALALSLSAVGASAASEPYYLTPEEASALYSIQINTDVDTEVFIDEADALTYYNPMWTNPRTNTGYYFVERDTTITVTYLDDNPAGDDIPIMITLTPYRLQADGSYVSALEEATFYEMWADGDPYTDTDYIYYCTDGNFHPLSEFADNSEYAMQYGYGFADYQSASLTPGDSATFTIPFDRFGDDADLMYEVQATLTYPQSDGSTRSSYRYARVILDQEAVAQLRAEQTGQPTQPEQPVDPETPVEPEQPIETVTSEGTVTYTVQQGDTLGFITTNYYDNNAQRNALYRANIESFRATNGQLRPGMTLVIPETLDGVERLSYPMAGDGETLYTVKAGDTLSKIAQSVYGDMWRYQDIFERNSDRLKNANTIYEGQVIVLPQ